MVEAALEIGFKERFTESERQDSSWQRQLDRWKGQMGAAIVTIVFYETITTPKSKYVNGPFNPLFFPPIPIH